MADAGRSSDTVFGAIARGEIPADVVYEDEHCIAFRDLAPQAPVHVLVIPRLGLSGLQEADRAEPELLGRLIQAAKQVADLEGLDGGWRLVINVGEDAGQSVAHLHLHVLGGRRLAWPPG